MVEEALRTGRLPMPVLSIQSVTGCVPTFEVGACGVVWCGFGKALIGRNGRIRGGRWLMIIIEHTGRMLDDVRKAVGRYV